MKTFDNGLIVDNSTSPPTCCGFIFSFQGHGDFSPDGKVDGFTSEQIQEHNASLSKAQLLGLDQYCQVGQGGTFYYSQAKGVTTCTGVVVAENDSVHIKGASITFTRNGKTYRGRLQKNADCFNFRRIQ